MGIKITDLSELVSVADDDVLPIVDISTGETKKIKKSTLGSGISYGGAVTAGHNDQVLFISGTGTLASSSGLTYSAGSGLTVSGINATSLQVNPSGNNIDIRNANVQWLLDGGGGRFNLVNFVDNAGMYYAAAASGGLSGAEVGLGIDILNDVYTLGNPSAGLIKLEATKTTFTQSVINIGGKDIDFSANNAAGVVQNDGSGLFSYVQSAGWAANTAATSKADFDDTLVTLTELAQRVAALIQELTTLKILAA